MVLLFLIGGILFINAAGDTVLVAENGRLYTKTTAPFGINFETRKDFGMLPENVRAVCFKGVPHRAAGNSKSNIEKYSLKLAKDRSSTTGGFVVKSYSSMAACNVDARAIESLAYNKNFTYKFHKDATSYLLVVAGLVLFLIGLCVPFCKVLPAGEASKISRKAQNFWFGRKLTSEELKNYNATGELPPDVSSENRDKEMAEVKEFAEKYGESLETLDENLAKFNNIINIINKFK